MSELLLSLSVKYPTLSYVLMGLGTLVVVAQAVVVITPSKKDDEFLAGVQKGIFGKLLDLVRSFAPLQKKAKK